MRDPSPSANNSPKHFALFSSTPILCLENLFPLGGRKLIGLVVTWAVLWSSPFLHAQGIAEPAFSPMPPSLVIEPLGLFQSRDFDLATGNCQDCRTAPEALWYFQQEIIAIPTTLHAITTNTPLPFLIWLGSPEVLPHVRLTSQDSHVVLRNHTTIPVRLTPKIPSNRSYYNDSSTNFFLNQPLRLRGYFEQDDHTPTFVVKMIWPENFRLNLKTPPPDTTKPSLPLASQIEDQAGGARAPFSATLLWERHPGTARNWAHQAVVGLMLNGAQGDDDEAHGGHFGLVTGRVGPDGEMANWMMNNFYDLEVESEKGIIPSTLPLDHYLMDLNSGQSYYRPSYLFIAILRQDRLAKDIQASAQHVFEELYRHDFLYHHAKANCTGLSMDILRRLGWAIPHKGPTSYLKAMGAFYYLALTERSLLAGEKIYDYLTQEQTRLFPRMAFETGAQDLLHMVQKSQGYPERTFTPFERQLQEDIEALVFIRIPQIPSSRAYGTYPVLTFRDYQNRVPDDRNDWETVPVSPRPFPKQFQKASPQISARPFFTPTTMLVTTPASLIGALMLYRLFLKKRAKGIL